MLSVLLLPVVGLIALQIGYFVFIGRRQPHLPSPQDARSIARLRWIGSVVMACGLVASGWVYRHSQPGDGVDPDVIGYDVGYGYSTPIRASQSKKMVVAEEKLGGKFGVMLDQVQPWFISRWHGRQLAVTLVVLSGTVFAACFWWARMLTFPAQPGIRRAKGPTDVVPEETPHPKMNRR